MDFLKRFISPKNRGDGLSSAVSSFSELSDEQLETHLKIARYGSFILSDAVRPSYDLQVVPRTGFRHDTYSDVETGIAIPVLMASASREVVLDLFLDLLDPLGTEVDVVLETSHHSEGRGHVDLYRENIDLPVLKSVLWDYEDLLTNDGCSGIAVLNPSQQQEVQFDEHKILLVYGNPLDRFEEILESYGVPHRDDIQFITEAEHVHSSRDEYRDSFDLFRTRIGAESYRG